MKLTEEQRKQLIADWRGRITHQTLAEKYNLTKKAVAMIIARANRQG